MQEFCSTHVYDATVSLLLVNYVYLWAQTDSTLGLPRTALIILTFLLDHITILHYTNQQSLGCWVAFDYFGEYKFYNIIILYFELPFGEYKFITLRSVNHIGLGLGSGLYINGSETPLPKYILFS